MTEHKNSSFRDMNIKEKIITILGIALLLILVSCFVLGLYFFGIVGVFELLGVEYNSIWSVVVFVVSFFILGVIVELFTKAILKLCIQKGTGKTEMFIFRIIFEGASNWLVLFIVDSLMTDISLITKTEIIIALIVALIEVTFDRDNAKVTKTQ
nr:YrvL family regulatory protein [Lysinibacillus timonensis]